MLDDVIALVSYEILLKEFDNSKKGVSQDNSNNGSLGIKLGFFGNAILIIH